MTELVLALSISGHRNTLRRSWERGDPGSLGILLELAVLSAESLVRGTPLPPIHDPAQLALPLAC